MTKTLYVSILSRAEPGSVETDASQSALAAEVLATWRRLIPSMEDDGHGDKEDFWEMAFRLHAALHAGATVYVSLNLTPFTLVEDGEWGAEQVSVSDAYARASEDPTSNALYGPLALYSPGNLVPLPQEKMATLYACLGPFRAHSGRRIDLVSVGDPYEDEDPGVSVQEKLLEYREAGETRAAIKSVTAKRFPLTVFDIAPGNDPFPAEVDESVSDWAFCLMGLAEAFILQGYIDVQYEYRMFVVGGKPVTGAANVEEFTPLDFDGDAFDSKMRQFRKERSEVVAEPERLAGYIEFATEVAAEFAEQEGLVDYVLDIATDGATGRLFIVELNGLPNSGLFASDPTRVTKALVD